MYKTSKYTWKLSFAAVVEPRHLENSEQEVKYCARSTVHVDVEISNNRIINQKYQLKTNS